MQGVAIITKKTEKELHSALSKISCMHTYSLQGRSWGISFQGNCLLISLADCVPTKTFLAIIDGGTVYANKISSVITEVLRRERIDFREKSVSLPSHISKIIEEKRKQASAHA